MKESKRLTAEHSHEYLMGYDCGINGANETNCDFRLFATPEKTRQWEQGKKDAEKPVMQNLTQLQNQLK